MDVQISSVINSDPKCSTNSIRGKFWKMCSIPPHFTLCLCFLKFLINIYFLQILLNNIRNKFYKINNGTNTQFIHIGNNVFFIRIGSIISRRLNYFPLLISFSPQNNINLTLNSIVWILTFLRSSWFSKLNDTI